MIIHGNAKMKSKKGIGLREQQTKYIQAEMIEK